MVHRTDVIVAMLPLGWGFMLPWLIIDGLLFNTFSLPRHNSLSPSKNICCASAVVAQEVVYRVHLSQSLMWET